ncbi:Fluoroacetate dehalogenase [bacterium YEK0313]|nr:Fluoroacetate dehalogenase [bacterium YEK0313]
MQDHDALPGFEARTVDTGRGRVFVRQGGTGPAVLLLHGFPQTGLMWHKIAPALADVATVVVADLPGYGRSSPPDASADHAAMSKRAMAGTLVAAMQALGHDNFAIVGHDRGARVAYRAAVDHARRISRIAVLDVVPTHAVWERADARLALGFWPFSLLAQPAPLPERLILAAPEAVVDDALAQWGSDPQAFPGWIRAAYVAALRDPDRVHTICEDYRAAATVDWEIDRADLAAGRRIACPVLALWSEHGALAEWYDDAGGPLGLWRRWADKVEGRPVPGGHFFPEERPAETSRLVAAFLRASPAP